MTTSKIQMDQIRSTSATDTGENIRAGSQKKSSLSPAEGLQGASPDATCTCPSGDGSLRHPCPAHPAVEQAGGDERVIGWRERILAAHPNSDPGFWPDALLIEHMAAEIADLRAALAQPSPAQAEQAEADLRRLAEAAEFGGGAHEDIEFSNQLDFHAACTPAAIVALLDEIDRLKAENERLANDRDRANRFANTAALDKDAALARVAELEAKFVELEKQEPVAFRLLNQLGEVMTEWHDGKPPEKFVDLCGNPVVDIQVQEAYAAPVAKAQQLHDMDKQCRDDVARALGLRPSQERGFAWSYLLASIKSCVKAAEDTDQAQHSVPEGWKLVPMDPTSQMTFVGQSLRYDAVNSIGEIYRQMVAAAPGTEVPQAWLDVQAERRRQITAEGWTPEHDDKHNGGELADAAACYALWAGGINPGNWREFWPWAPEWLKHSEPRRMLVKAGALILAEIERLDRGGAPC